MKLTMKKLTSIISIFLLVILIVNASSLSMASEKSSINIIVKGKLLKTGVKPIIKEGTTYIHVRDFAKALDYQVDWLATEKTVKLSDSDTTILIPINQNTISINDKKITLKQKNFLDRGITFIPLRSLAEALWHRVQWDGKNNIAIVGKFTGEEYLEDTFLYTNEEYKYTMNFPKTWEKEAVLESTDGILRVYDKASYDKFKEKGFKNFGPVFEIKVEKSPIFISVPYEDVLLNYSDGKYIETYFGEDFQYFPDTVESYKKIYDEAKKSLGSFKSLDPKDKEIEDAVTKKEEVEIFTYAGLKLEITNVEDIRVESMIDDGGTPWEYKVFKYHPEATVSVINADMNDGSFTEDGKATPNWGINLSTDERIRIVDNMKSFEITPDIIGVYNLESSLYVLRFEMMKEVTDDNKMKK